MKTSKIRDAVSALSLVRRGRLPDYIIIGTQRGGTTSLFHYLSKNSAVLNPRNKEFHFFSEDFKKGIPWYKTQFPAKEGTITGESTPYYLFHPLCAERIARALPQVSLIVMLRNPVTRAYSNYSLEVEHHLEPLSFEDAIKEESARTQGEEERIIREGSYNSSDHRRYSYLARGLYVQQIKRYTKYFPRKKILILKSEDFFKDPAKTTREVQEFLGLPIEPMKELKKHNGTELPKMKSETRRKLEEHFKPYNEELYSYLGIDFNW